MPPGHVEDGDLTVIQRIGPGQWAAHFELVQVLHHLEILQYIALLYCQQEIITIWLFNMALENCPHMEGLW